MNQRSALLTLVALVLGMVVALVFVAPLLRERGGPEATGGGAREDLVELARAQHRTAEALERLEALLADRLEGGTGLPDARRPVGGSPAPESLDDLIRSLDALRATLEREAQVTQGLIRGSPAFGGESLLDVRSRRTEPDWDALADLETAWGRDERAADRSQYFQTARDLLEAYGPPTAIYRPEGGMLFHYRRGSEESPGPQWYFRLQDGIVIEFFVEQVLEEDEGSF